MRKSGSAGWAALGLTIFAFDVAAAVVVAPVAVRVLREQDSRVVLDLGRNAAKRVVQAMSTQATRVAGEGLIVAAKGASRLYGAMLSVTPEAEIDKASRDAAPASFKMAPRAECTMAAPTAEEAMPSAPARYCSPTL